MYHSTATLLPDGRIFLAGSNPNYDVTTVKYQTEFRIEYISRKSPIHLPCLSSASHWPDVDDDGLSSVHETNPTYLFRPGNQYRLQHPVQVDRGVAQRHDGVASDGLTHGFVRSQSRPLVCDYHHMN